MPIKRSTTKIAVPDIAPEESSPTPSRKPKGSARISPLTIAVIVIVLVTAVVLGIQQTLSRTSKGSEKAASPTASTSAPEGIRELIEKVSKHIAVNPGEDPTVATIQDIGILKQQNPTFYKDAQNGDRLLVWTDKAVLYSPTRDIILSVLPISLPPSALNQPAGAATSTSETATIEVRNGSGTVGLATTLSKKLTSPGMTVLKPADASTTYAKTVIVKITDKELPQTLQALELVTDNASVVALPEGEKPSKADFLIIVGADMVK
ncbi:LytR C-terminal domain-containing protein [Candidatus Uhrbacteria bacterium]|nr:LytR C-terminal domain-containing protein [Candidatus Uhrbacteria bacterium]